jgi:hypothetical protein
LNPQSRTRTHWHIFYQYFQGVAKYAKCQFMPKKTFGGLFSECFRRDNDMPILLCQNRVLANRKLLKSLQCQMPIYATLKGEKKLAHFFANLFTLDFRAISVVSTKERSCSMLGIAKSGGHVHLTILPASRGCGSATAPVWPPGPRKHASGQANENQSRESLEREYQRGQNAGKVMGKVKRR